MIGSIEHSSIATTAYYLKDQKHFEALFPNQHGTVYVERLLDLEQPDLISLMLVNNEIGTNYSVLINLFVPGFSCIPLSGIVILIVVP